VTVWNFVFLVAGLVIGVLAVALRWARHPANADVPTLLEEARRAHREAVESSERLRLSATASMILASSLDYRQTIATAARFAVPDHADWCSVDLLIGREIKQLAVSHIDSETFRRMSEFRAQHPLDLESTTGVAYVIRTGEPSFMPFVTDERVAAHARNPEHLAMLRKLDICSAMIIPMIARGKVIGALTVLRVRPHPPYTEASLALGIDLARRAAVAIDNARLYEAALAANEAKANFLAAMSDELRTPLTAIVGYQELLTEGIPGAVNKAQGEQLGRIKASAERLLGLIDEILQYARLESGRETIHVDTVVAKAVVDEAMAIVVPAASDRHLALVADKIDPALTLQTDAHKLRQVLVSLLTNAVRFTERGSVTVRSFARGVDVVFEVEDTGPGIAPENQEKIFDAFWQVEQDHTRPVRGGGLGLSTARRLARLLGGDLTVDSRPSHGSTFRIVLPRPLIAVGPSARLQ
jgi:signal transduction histidine kinase